MTNSHHNRGLLLFNQGRYEEATRELQDAVIAENDNPFAHGLLALCLSAQDRHQPALEAAKRSIELAPDSDYGHFVLARVYTDRQKLNEAFQAITTAIQLSPEDAMNHACLARIEYERSNWNEAVAAADAGLTVDAENDMCLHYRSLALTKLGRSDEARRDQETLLAVDPNDPHSHAARGWTLLEDGEAAKAKEHFLEALRLDPTLDYARIGLANALKARHFLFGLALRCLLYLDRFRAWVIWIFMIGFFVGLRQLERFGQSYPEAVVPISLIKAAFWTILILIIIAHPLFDLILRLDRDGRRTMSPDQTRASNWHAVCLVVALGMGLAWAWRGDIQMRTLAMPTLMLTYAITMTFNATPGWVRTRMGWVTLFAAALIPLAFVGFVASLFLLLQFKINTAWMIKPTLLYLPLLSTLISAFSDNIVEFLERRRPDATS